MNIIGETIAEKVIIKRNQNKKHSNGENLIDELNNVY